MVEEEEDEDERAAALEAAARAEEEEEEVVVVVGVVRTVFLSEWMEQSLQMKPLASAVWLCEAAPWRSSLTLEEPCSALDLLSGWTCVHTHITLYPNTQ